MSTEAAVFFLFIFQTYPNERILQKYLTIKIYLENFKIRNLIKEIHFLQVLEKEIYRSSARQEPGTPEWYMAASTKTKELILLIFLQLDIWVMFCSGAIGNVVYPFCG